MGIYNKTKKKLRYTATLYQKLSASKQFSPSDQKTEVYCYQLPDLPLPETIYRYVQMARVTHKNTTTQQSQTTIVAGVGLQKSLHRRNYFPKVVSFTPSETSRLGRLSEPVITVASAW
jgi:hypothetical protein